MYNKLHKFSKQISKVEGLEHKYKHLYSLTQEFDNSASETYSILETVAKCYDLVKSQMKH